MIILGTKGLMCKQVLVNMILLGFMLQKIEKRATSLMDKFALKKKERLKLLT